MPLELFIALRYLRAKRKGLFAFVTTAIGAAPVISSCGATPNGGTISVGGGVVTACTLTFAAPRVNTPDCVISDNSTSVTGDLSSVSASAITVSFSASLGGGNIFYQCWGD